MPLQLIGAGYGRTGTLSMQAALNQLGFNCYHMEEVLNTKKNNNHMDFWVNVALSSSGQRHHWEDVFSDYVATVDNPGCCVWRELYKTYPDAKVLLSLHPKGPEAWYESTMKTIYFSEMAWEYSIIAFFVPLRRKMKRLAHHLVWERSHQETMTDPSAAIARYRAHIEEVKSIVPDDKLLIYSVDQGWGPLCKFLNVEIPDNDFPRLNDTKQFRKQIMEIKLKAYFILLVGIVMIALLIYAFFIFF